MTADSSQQFGNQQGSGDIALWLSAFLPDKPVVVIPVFNAYEDVLECLESVLATLPPDTPLLVIDDASSDDRIRSVLGPLSKQHRFFFHLKPHNTGFVNTVNLAFNTCTARDVVVINSDTVVPTGWLERLREAAYSRTNIATATPLTNYGSAVSVPQRNTSQSRLPDGLTLAQIDEKIQRTSLKLRPLLPTAIGHLTYFKRTALDTVGGFDEIFSPGYGEEVDFSQRATLAGFCHVAADDLFIYHKGSRSFDQHYIDERKRIQADHEQILKVRYPWYHPYMRRMISDPYSPLAQTIEQARYMISGPNIAIDLTCIDGSTTGTQVIALELVNALIRRPDWNARLFLIVLDTTPLEHLKGLEKQVTMVFRVSDVLKREQPTFDLVHRPFQTRTWQDLQLLQRSATRYIVSQLDFIAYTNPGYAPSFERWEEYRQVIAQTLNGADGVVFISQDGRADAAQQGIVIPDERVCVSYCGVDHALRTSAHAPIQAPSGLANQPGLQPFILILGVNFKHKNRVFGLKVLKHLIDKYGWQGKLVIAGPQAAYGGSGAEEALYKLHNPQIREQTIDLGSVTEGEKRWLFENASLVLYPSQYEGFGLVPFEAAACGTSTLTMPTTSLPEVLGNEVIYFANQSPEVGAELVWQFLNNPALCEAQVQAIQTRASVFTWHATAERAHQFYQRILSMPVRNFSKLDIVLAASDPSSQTTPKRLRSRVHQAWQIFRSEGLGTAIYKSVRFVLRKIKLAT